MYHGLELFGASRRLQDKFMAHGLAAASLDIALGGDSHDVLSRDGFYNWLFHLLQLLLGYFRQFFTDGPSG